MEKAREYWNQFSRYMDDPVKGKKAVRISQIILLISQIFATSVLIFCWLLGF